MVVLGKSHGSFTLDGLDGVVEQNPPLVPLYQRGKITIRELFPLFGKEGPGEILNVLDWSLFGGIVCGIYFRREVILWPRQMCLRHLKLPRLILRW
jgi:hypothetical protein